MKASAPRDEGIINMEQLERSYQNDKEVLPLAICAFLEQSETMKSSLENALKTKDPKALEISAHTLKGAASNFYASEVVILAGDLEQMGRRKTLDGAKEKLGLLVNKLNELKLN